MVAKRYLGKLRMPFPLWGRTGCLRRIVLPITVAAAAVVGMRAALTQYVTPSDVPALGLKAGDRVLVDRISIVLSHAPQEGSAVAFRHPDCPDKICLGRIDAVGGDTVEGRFIVPAGRFWTGGQLRRLVPNSSVIGRPVCVRYSIHPVPENGKRSRLPRPQRFFLTIR